MNITRTEMLCLTRVALNHAHVSLDSRLGRNLLEEAAQMKAVTPFTWWDFHNDTGCLVGSYRRRRGKSGRSVCPWLIGRQARVGWEFQEAFRARYGSVKGVITISNEAIGSDEMYVPAEWTRYHRIPTSV